MSNKLFLGLLGIAGVIGIVVLVRRKPQTLPYDGGCPAGYHAVSDIDTGVTFCRLD